MKILHITPHFGGGVGTVLLDWLVAEKKINKHRYTIACLDYINPNAWQIIKKCEVHHMQLANRMFNLNKALIENYDIVFVHWWDSPFLKDLFSHPFPKCRLVFWCHKNYILSPKEIAYPDRFFGTAPCQGLGEWVWSTRNMEIFQNNVRCNTTDFNVGTIGAFKKLHEHFERILLLESHIDNVKFFFAGDIPIASDERVTNYGNVGDAGLMDIYSKLDVFYYPLTRNHYGTCEQVLGEAMISGVVPIVLDNQCEKEIVENGLTGFVARDVYDMNMFVKILREYPDIRKRMARKTTEAAFYKYQQYKMISDWHRVFNGMMDMEKIEREPLFRKPANGQAEG